MVSLLIQQLYRDILTVADENGGNLKKEFKVLILKGYPKTATSTQKTRILTSSITPTILR